MSLSEELTHFLQTGSFITAGECLAKGAKDAFHPRWTVALVLLNGMCANRYAMTEKPEAMVRRAFQLADEYLKGPQAEEVQPKLSCFLCANPIDEQEAVWVDPDTGEATTGDSGKPYHVACAPAQEKTS